jgi:hypothetical protein
MEFVRCDREVTGYDRKTGELIATYDIPAPVRFSDLRAGGYVRSRDGALARAQPGARLFLEAGHHILTLHDPKLVARVSITFEAY